eukprot:TRINITY_DN1346_c0_g1_i3.p2 TRINITY_DN1346_c0_g1~~TRINITY_DN1346_c0_g1_i3.p2  ORF type:complete len:129 (-),score=41.92 TRINITY_DN1346_c0_g1_i3:195-581(-)
MEQAQPHVHVQSTQRTWCLLVSLVLVLAGFVLLAAVPLVAQLAGLSGLVLLTGLCGLVEAVVSTQSTGGSGCTTTTSGGEFTRPHRPVSSTKPDRPANWATRGTAARRTKPARTRTSDTSRHHVRCVL